MRRAVMSNAKNYAFMRNLFGLDTNLCDEYAKYRCPLISLKYDKGTVWYPFKSKLSKYKFNLEHLRYTDKIWGANGSAALHYDIIRDFQPLKVFWVGVDIDDSPEQPSEVLKHRLYALAQTRDDFYLRTSKSGKGYHLYCVLNKPVSSPIASTGAYKATIIHDLLQDLNLLGIKVCSKGGNMWISGGLQETLYAPSKGYKVPTVLPTLDAHSWKLAHDSTGPAVSVSDCFYYAKELHRLLYSAGLMPEEFFRGIPTYVKNAHRILKNTIYEFKTDSPMLSDSPHVNGYFSIAPGTSRYQLRLWTFADQKIVKSWELC
jgi:hypothetical protein